MKNFISFFSGLLFGIGLIISQMINPEKVIGFLDITGSWDYSLAFVMGGAVITNLFLFKWILRKKPIFCESHSLSQKKHIDKQLIIGSSLFGTGWGLSGICPGPGIVNLISFSSEAFIFMAALVVGMFAHKLLRKI